MAFESWHAFYTSELQSLWALLVVPSLFLLYLLLHPPEPGGGVDPSGARFLRIWAFVFCVETLVDPIATGPLLRWIGAADGAFATALMLCFVLLGDFRVYALVFGLARGASLPRALGEAALWTLAVPAFAWPVDWLLRAVAGELPSQVLWLVYECAFAGLALWLRARVVPARVGAARAPLRSQLRAVLGYAALYYALWALADASILIGGLDAGWLLRALPNQLYYGLFVPFAYFAFFSRRFATRTVTERDPDRA